MGKFKKSRTASLFCSCKSAFLITKKFTFQKIFRHGSHINGDKWSICPSGSLMERMSHQFFSCTSLTHKKDRAVCCRHFPQNIFCFCNRCGNTYHVIQRISGIMAFLHHLPSKGILTGLLLIKLLEHGKGTYAVFLPHNRHYCKGNIGSKQTDYLLRNRFFLTKDLIKRNIRKNLFPLFPHSKFFRNAGDLTCLFIAYKNISCFVHTDQTFIQAFRQNMHLAFLPAAFSIHQVKAVVIGGHYLSIIHKAFCFRQIFQSQTQSYFYHHSIGTGTVITVDHCFYRRRHKTGFTGSYRNIHRFF